MWKPRPRDASIRLFVSGRYAAFRDSGPAWGTPRYELDRDGMRATLDDAQWADWSRAGSLVVATRSGSLEVREAPYTASDAGWHHDLAALRPTPEAPPPEASRWA